MANSYSKTIWVDNSAPAINATNLAKIETALSNMAYAVDAGANQVPVGNGASGITWQQIGDAQVASNAAIALSKLADPGAGNVVTSTGAGAVAAKPPGYRFAYTEFTSSVSVTATTEATANTVVTASAVTFDGSTVVRIEFYSAALNKGTTNVGLWLYDGSSSIGQIAFSLASTVPILVAREITPSAASHTYSIRANVDAGTGSVAGGAGGTGAVLPGYIKITKVA